HDSRRRRGHATAPRRRHRRPDIARRKAGHALHLPRFREQQPEGGGVHLGPPAPPLRRFARYPPVGLASPVAARRPEADESSLPATGSSAAPPVPPAADRLAKHHRPRRGPSSPWPAWRSLPGARLLGRAVRLSSLQLAATRTDPLVSDVQVPP